MDRIEQLDRKAAEKGLKIEVVDNKWAKCQKCENWVRLIPPAIMSIEDRIQERRKNKLQDKTIPERTRISIQYSYDAYEQKLKRRGGLLQQNNNRIPLYRSSKDEVSWICGECKDKEEIRQVYLSDF